MTLQKLVRGSCTKKMYTRSHLKTIHQSLKKKSLKSQTKDLCWCGSTTQSQHAGSKSPPGYRVDMGWKWTNGMCSVGFSVAGQKYGDHRGHKWMRNQLPVRSQSVCMTKHQLSHHGPDGPDTVDHHRTCNIKHVYFCHNANTWLPSYYSKTPERLIRSYWSYAEQFWFQPIRDRLPPM